MPPASRTASRSGTAQRCSIASTRAELPSGKILEQLEGEDLGCGGRVGIHVLGEFDACGGAFEPSEAQSDECTDGRTQLGALFVVEVADRHDGDLVLLTYHEHGIDHADLADVAQAHQLVGDATFEEVVLRKADQKCLDWSDGHGWCLLHVVWVVWNGAPAQRLS